MSTWNKHVPALHREVILFLTEMDRVKVRPMHEVGLEEARKRMDSLAVENTLTFAFQGERTEMELGEENERKVPCYVYKPSQIKKDPLILVFFHGGANCLGSRLNADYPCKLLSMKLEAIAVNVEYRLAPEHKFPANVDDACVATRWVLNHKTELGGSENSKVGVAGDSAGGALAATVAHDVPGLSFQILIYPHLMPKGDRSLPSYTRFKHGPLLTEEDIDFFEGLMCNPEDRADPRNANLMRATFDHLPPTLLILAECDPFLSDGLEYESKLRKSGVPTRAITMAGAIHGFYGMSRKMPGLCMMANNHIGYFIESVLRRELDLSLKKASSEKDQSGETDPGQSEE